MDIDNINTSYNDSSVIAGFDELRKITADLDFAQLLCKTYNNAFNSVDICHAPCRDLISHTDDMITKIISVYSTQLGLLCPGLDYDTTTSILTPSIAFIPSHSLLKTIRLIANQY